jgi:uncharacterized membrane-anchored protein
MRGTLVVGGLVLVVGVSGALIADKERVLANGAEVLLELAPVDPRSLIQGDYMALDYAINREIGEQQRVWPRNGHIVVRLDSLGVARFVRRHGTATPLRPGEQLLTYRRRRGRAQIGTDAFHFQEGHAHRYASARYGELRVAPSGTSVLVGLRDSTRRPLGETVRQR